MSWVTLICVVVGSNHVRITKHYELKQAHFEYISAQVGSESPEALCSTDPSETFQSAMLIRFRK